MKLFKIILLILFLILGFFVYLKFFEFPKLDLNYVKKGDWDDSWRRLNISNEKCSIYNFNSNYNEQYIFRCFNNTTNDFRSIIDTLNNLKGDKNTVYFLWNDKYNHPWKVEYINDRYVDSVATLFKVDIIKKNEKNYIKNLVLFPILVKNRKFLPIILMKYTQDNSYFFELKYNSEIDLYVWYELHKLIQFYSNNNSAKGELKFILNYLDKIIIVQYINSIGYIIEIN